MEDKELKELEQEALAELEPQQEEQPDEELPEVEEKEEIENLSENEEASSDDDEQIQDPIETEEGEVAEPEKDDHNKSLENDIGIELKKPVKIKARGMEVDINNPQELIELAHKGFDYFKKTQELAKWRKDIKVIEENGLSAEELKLLADVKSGNKEAISALLNTYGFDPLDIEPEQGANYKPNVPSPIDFEIESIVEEIQREPQHAQHFSKIVDVVPDDFLNEVASDPVKLRHFNDHVKRGIADKVVPEALKAQAIYGGSFMDHYTRIGQQIMAQEQNVVQQQRSPQTVQQPIVQQPTITDREREMRKKATTPKRGGGKKTSFIKDAESIWELDDESFAKLTAKDLQ